VRALSTPARQHKLNTKLNRPVFVQVCRRKGNVLFDGMSQQLAIDPDSGETLGNVNLFDQKP